MIFVTGLFIYHCGLVFNNLTTKEELGGFYENFYGNPYNRIKVKESIKDAFCPSVAIPSMLDTLELNEMLKNKKEEIVDNRPEIEMMKNKNDLIEEKINRDNHPLGKDKMGSGTTTQINEIKLDFAEKNGNNCDSNVAMNMHPNEREFISGSSKNTDLFLKKHDLLESQENLNPDKFQGFLKIKKYMDPSKNDISKYKN